MTGEHLLMLAAAMLVLLLAYAFVFFSRRKISTQQKHFHEQMEWADDASLGEMGYKGRELQYQHQVEQEMIEKRKAAEKARLQQAEAKRAQTGETIYQQHAPPHRHPHHEEQGAETFYPESHSKKPPHHS